LHSVHVLKNGIQLIYKPMMNFESICIGIWIKTGSVNESINNNGVSHLIEHMLFKGTETRSARELSSAIDNIGGEINAFTSKECTCFYIKILSEHLETTFKILNDMVFHSTFKEEQIKVEKKVILDEIKMYEDSAEDIVDDMMQALIYKDHPLGLPILGTRESVKNLSRASILSYYNTHYYPQNMVISVAGKFDERELTTLAKKYFEFEEDKTDTLVACKVDLPSHNWGLTHFYKDNEQVHVIINFPAVPYEHPLAYALMILNQILGATNSSYLFQNIRESHGLCYSIYSETEFFDGIGTLGIVFACSKEDIDQTLLLIIDIIEEIMHSHDLVQKQVETAKIQIISNMLFGLETTDSYMDWLGRIQVFKDREDSVEAIISNIEAVTTDNLDEVIKIVFENHVSSMAIVGDLSYDDATSKYNSFIENLTRVVNKI